MRFYPIFSVRESLLPAVFEKDAYRSWPFHRRLLLLFGPERVNEILIVNQPLTPIYALVGRGWTMTRGLDAGQHAGDDFIILASEVGERIAAQPYRVLFDHIILLLQVATTVTRSGGVSGTPTRRRVRRMSPTSSHADVPP